MFLLALFISMGTTLFSCSDKNGNKQKIDKIEVIDNSIIEERVTVGEAPLNSNNSLHHKSPPPLKTGEVKFARTPLTSYSNTTHRKPKDTVTSITMGKIVKPITIIEEYEVMGDGVFDAIDIDSTKTKNK